MTHSELLASLTHLTVDERLALIEEALRTVRTDLARKAEPTDERRGQLAAAAGALADDYEHDAELTAFTILDGIDA
ncbi:MAG: hypothetical protein HY744_13525 [Deltaproteobacteria bacterium]|nr:hypothetical protein [Deltaproteobacteria bacterium]